MYSVTNTLQEFKNELYKQAHIAKISHRKITNTLRANAKYEQFIIRKVRYYAEGPSFFGNEGELECPNLPTLAKLVDLTTSQLICMTNDAAVTLFAAEFVDKRPLKGKTPPKIIVLPKRAGIGLSVSRKRAQTGQHGKSESSPTLQMKRSQKVGKTITRGGKKGGGQIHKPGKHGVQKTSRSLSAVRSGRVSKAGTLAR